MSCSLCIMCGYPFPDSTWNKYLYSRKTTFPEDYINLFSMGCCFIINSLFCDITNSFFFFFCFFFLFLFFSQTKSMILWYYKLKNLSAKHLFESGCSTRKTDPIGLCFLVSALFLILTNSPGHGGQSRGFIIWFLIPFDLCLLSDETRKHSISFL